jgi:urocanate hydratase
MTWLTVDHDMGIARHADAGYPVTIEAARKNGIKISMLE